MGRKRCPPPKPDQRYLCNPETGNWVLKSGKKGSQIVAQRAKERLRERNKYIRQLKEKPMFTPEPVRPPLSVQKGKQRREDRRERLISAVSMAVKPKKTAPCCQPKIPIPPTMKQRLSSRNLAPKMTHIPKLEKDIGVLDGMRRELRTLKREGAPANQTLKLQRQITQLENQKKDALLNLEKQKALLTERERELSHTKKIVDELAHRVRKERVTPDPRLQSQLEEHKSRLQSTQSQLRKLTQLESEVKQGKYIPRSAHQQEIRKLQDRLKGVVKDLETSKGVISNQTQAARDLKKHQQRLRNLNAENESLRDEMDTLRQAARRDITQDEEEIAQISGEYAVCRERLAQNQELIGAIEDQAKSLQQELQTTKTRCAKGIDQLKQRDSQWSQRYDLISQELDKNRGEIADLLGLNRQCKADNALLDQEIEKTKASYLASEQTNSSLNRQMEKFQAALDQCQDRLKKSAKMGSKFQSDNQVLKAEIEENKKIMDQFEDRFGKYKTEWDQNFKNAEAKANQDLETIITEQRSKYETLLDNLRMVAQETTNQLKECREGKVSAPLLTPIPPTSQSLTAQEPISGTVRQIATELEKRSRE